MLIYTLTTTVTILLLEAVGLALVWYATFRSAWLPDPFGQKAAQLAADLAPYLLSSALLVIPATALMGMLLGFVTARSLTGRLRRLTEAATAWGQGDFDRLSHDTSSDELGQLARHLYHMAIQLRRLLETRQELATLEERNRLARDLHDSIKQQVFATAMQVATAQALLPHDPEGAQAHLAESQRLVQQTQQELTGLIHELRPGSLEGRFAIHSRPGQGTRLDIRLPQNAGKP